MCSVNLSIELYTRTILQLLLDVSLPGFIILMSVYKYHQWYWHCRNLSYYLSTSMEQIHPWEGYSRSASQEIVHLLWEAVVLRVYCVCMRSQLGLSLSEVNPIHILCISVILKSIILSSSNSHPLYFYFSKIHFSITPHLAQISKMVSFFQVFRLKPCVNFSPPPHCIPPISSSIYHRNSI
jgi:hypothetical protein